MIKDLLADHVVYMTEFQHDHFVTARAGGTLYGQYKQAVRELEKRIRGLRDAYCSHDLLLIDIDEQRHLCEHGEGEFDRRRAEVELKRKTLSVDESTVNIKETEREATSFYRQAAQLKEHLGELTAEKRDALEREMWEYLTKYHAAISVLATGHISSSAIEMALALRGDERKRVLSAFEDPKDLCREIEVLTEKNTQLINGKRYPALDFRKTIEELPCSHT